MITAAPRADRTLGFTAADHASPLARWWNPVLPRLPAHIHDALAGPVPPALLPDLEHIASWLDDDRPRLDSGFTAHHHSAQLMLRTPLPNTTPAMIDWWFAWHSDEPARYKLWHPAAHVHASWQQRPPHPERCVGGISVVDEYVGHELGRFAIAFLPPSQFGFDDVACAAASITVARIGLPAAPIDAGYLLHHVRAVEGGAEMRSFFWLGGRWAGARGFGDVGDAVVHTMAPLLKPTLNDARALLLHCAQEMSHLATFLPSLYAHVMAGGAV